MASWLKAAEVDLILANLIMSFKWTELGYIYCGNGNGNGYGYGYGYGITNLFEVVDRRAKKVVTELADEPSDSNSPSPPPPGPGPAVNRKGPQNKRSKAKAKAQKREAAKDSTKSGDNNAREQSSSNQASQPDSKPDKDKAAPSIENDVITIANNSVPEASSEIEHHVEKDASASSEPPANDAVKHGDDNVIVVPVDATVSSSNSEHLDQKVPEASEEQPPSTSSAKEIEIVNEDSRADEPQKIKVRDLDIPSKTEEEKPQAEVIDTPLKTETQAKDAEVKVETLVNQNEKEQKADFSEKVQEQLEEAQGLLKTAASTGQSKEARLARVCAGLSNRLQEYKSENAQLEELLFAERELSKSYEAHIKQLQQDLSISKGEITKVESNMVEALSAKNSEIEALVGSMDALKKQAALSEGNLASMQANMESLMRNRELTETRMMQMQAWQEEVERARQGQRDAESKLSTMEVELQKVRVEMAAMKRDAEHYSRQEHMELEKRYRELTDLLYYKQTQLETMASDKAAAEFQLEKELKRHKEAQMEAEKTRVPRRASSSYWEEETEMNSLEPLPIYHRHMATASIQLQKAAKLLDSGAVRATRFLWRYPTARILLLLYLVFVHFFLMYLLHRLQEQAADFSDRAIAESMGLNTTLP
ncbi:hypothetical protein ACFE04_015715 [Oxalis oulophora]